MLSSTSRSETAAAPPTETATAHPWQAGSEMRNGEWNGFFVSLFLYIGHSMDNGEGMYRMAGELHGG